ncbi:MAG: L-aspartate oxidase [Candidatus Altiarchaeota archaeon]
MRGGSLPVFGAFFDLIEYLGDYFKDMIDVHAPLDLDVDFSQIYKQIRWDQIDCDVLVVGSGVAGLRAAIEVLSNKDCHLILLTKDELGLSDSWFAQGGVAAAIAGKGDIRAHYQDTLLAGAGLCTPKAVEVLVKEAPREIKSLTEFGCNFDMIEGKLDLSREGAHSQARVIHRRDSTGEEITLTLMKKVKDLGAEIMEKSFCLDLLVEGGVLGGLYVLDKEDRPSFIRPKVLVLASGGCCQVFKYTTNYGGAVGDGIGLAYRAGLKVMDMSFIQFHPTALDVGGDKEQLPLITEALRGEGAKIVDSSGKRFLEKYAPQGELSARDIVSRGIWEKMSTGEKVFLDATNFNEKFFQERFSTVGHLCAQEGLDPTKDLLPITPAAHYIMGGIQTDLYGRSSLEGVFAVGEVACTGVHGANRLASNSLAESLVFGKRAGYTAVTNLAKKQLGGVGKGSSRNSGGRGARKVIKDAKTKTIKASEKELEKIKTEIKEICWTQVGVIRIESSLETAEKALNKIIEKLKKLATPSKAYFEVVNMAITSRIITHAAQTRTESRGAHYRKDFPSRKKNWARHIIIKKGDKSLK